MTNDFTKHLFTKIASKIHFKNYCFLILATHNTFTAGLYPIKGNTASYSNQTVDIFEYFSEQIQELLKGTGVTIIHKQENNSLIIKQQTSYNPELFHQDLFQLLLFQDFGIKPQKQERIEILSNSIKKEKIKSTLVYACYTNNTNEIIERANNVQKSQLDKKLEYSGTPLGLCALNNNLLGFKSIASNGATISKKSLGSTPLQIAFKHSTDIVKYIFENHRDSFDKEFNKEGFYLLADCQDEELFELLKSIGGDLNKYNLSFPHLHNFTDRNNIIGINYCLKNGVDVNLKDKQNRTALSKAIMRGHIEAIELLKRMGGTSV